MKKLLFLISLINLSFIQPFANTACAQSSSTFVVSEVTGSVHKQNGKQKQQLYPTLTIAGKDMLILGSGATLILLSPKDNIRYTLKGTYTGTLTNYVKRNQQNCAKSITSKYMNYLLARTFRNKENLGQLEDDHATVFREGDDILDEDSITISVKSMDSLYHTIDSLSPSNP